MSNLPTTIGADSVEFIVETLSSLPVVQDSLGDYTSHQVRSEVYSNREALELLLELSHHISGDLVSRPGLPRQLLRLVLSFGNFLNWVIGQHFYRVFQLTSAKRYLRSFRNHLFVLGSLTRLLANCSAELFVQEEQLGKHFLEAFFQSYRSRHASSFADCVQLFFSFKHTGLAICECLTLIDAIYSHLSKLLGQLEGQGHRKYVLAVLGNSVFEDYKQRSKFFKVLVKMAEKVPEIAEASRVDDDFDFSFCEDLEVSESEDAEHSSARLEAVMGEYAKKYEKALRLFKRLAQPEEIHNNGKSAWNALKFLIWYTEKNDYESTELLEKYDSIGLLISLINFEHGKITEHVREEIDKEKPAVGAQVILSCSCAVSCAATGQECKAKIKSNNVGLNLMESAARYLYTACYYSQHTLEFSKAFHSNKEYLFAIFSIIKDDSWLTMVIKKPSSRISLKLQEILESYISFVYWLGKSCHLYEHVWNECDSISCLINFAEAMFMESRNYRYRAMMTIRNMHNYKSEAPDDQQVVKRLPFIYKPTDSDETQEAKNSQAIEYLGQLSDLEVTTRTSRDAIIYLSNVKTCMSYDSLKEPLQKSLIKFIKAFLESAGKRLAAFFKLLNLQPDTCQMRDKADAMKICYFLVDVLELCEHFGEESVKFRLDLHGQEPDGLRLILGLVNNKHALKQFSTAESKSICYFLICKIFDVSALIIVQTYKYKYDEPSDEKEEA